MEYELSEGWAPRSPPEKKGSSPHVHCTFPSHLNAKWRTKSSPPLTLLTPRNLHRSARQRTLDSWPQRATNPAPDYLPPDCYMRKKLDSLLLKPWSSDCLLQQPTRNLIESEITIFIYLLYIVSYCLWKSRSRRAGPLVPDTDTAGNNYESDHQYLLHACLCKSRVNCLLSLAQLLPWLGLLPVFSHRK